MKIVCYGDSNTFGYDPRDYFGEPYGLENCWVDILRDLTGYEVENWGLNGRTIPRYPVQFPQDMDFLVIMLGSNDLLQGMAPEDVAEAMGRFLETIPLNAEKTMVIAPPPFTIGEWVQDPEMILRSRQLVNGYRSVCMEQGVLFADAGEWNIELSFDGVHFTEAGHHSFAKNLYLELEKEL